MINKLVFFLINIRKLFCELCHIDFIRGQHRFLDQVLKDSLKNSDILTDLLFSGSICAVASLISVGII